MDYDILLKHYGIDLSHRDQFVFLANLVKRLLDSEEADPSPIPEKRNGADPLPRLAKAALKLHKELSSIREQYRLSMAQQIIKRCHLGDAMGDVDNMLAELAELSDLLGFAASMKRGAKDERMFRAVLSICMFYDAARENQRGRSFHGTEPTNSASEFVVDVVECIAMKNPRAFIANIPSAEKISKEAKAFRKRAKYQMRKVRSALNDRDEWKRLGIE